MLLRILVDQLFHIGIPISINTASATKNEFFLQIGRDWLNSRQAEKTHGKTYRKEK
jgi:hypothetical protein